MNRKARYFALTVSLVTSLAVAGYARLQAEPDVAETKIRLLSEALLARDSGDIERARKNLQQLLAITPNDETVKRLLASLDRVPQPKVTVSGAIVSTTPAGEASEADELARAEEQRLNALVEAAGVAAREARAMAKEQRFSQALATVDRAANALPENSLTQAAAAELAAVKAEILIAQEKHLASSARVPAAVAARPVDSAPVVVTSVETAPTAPASSEVAGLVARGRSQYLAGDSAAALVTFERVTAIEPGNSDARYFIERIQREQVAAGSERTRTSAQMITEVTKRGSARVCSLNARPASL